LEHPQCHPQRGLEFLVLLRCQALRGPSMTHSASVSKQAALVDLEEHTMAVGASNPGRLAQRAFDEQRCLVHLRQLSLGYEVEVVLNDVGTRVWADTGAGLRLDSLGSLDNQIGQLRERRR